MEYKLIDNTYVVRLDVGDEIMESLTALCKKEDIKARVDELLKLLKIKDIEKNEKDTESYLLQAQYDSNWREKTSIEEQKAIISSLADDKLVIPTVFSEAQFTEYYESVKSKATKAEDIVKYYSDFAMQFEHDVTDNLYFLRDFPNDKAISTFIETQISSPGALVIFILG